MSKFLKRIIKLLGFKLLLKKTAKSFGFEIQRLSRSTHELIESPKTKNIIFELMGPSGVGKTTFHSKMSNVLNFHWNMKYKPCGHINIEPKFSLDELYQRSLLLKSSNLYKRENNLERNAKLLRFFIKRAEQDHYLKYSGLLTRGGWFLDDGFCHTFHREIVEIIEKKLVPNDVLKNFFMGRRFLLLEAPINDIVENLRARQVKNKGALNDWLSELGKQRVIKFLQNEYDFRHKLLKLSTQYGTRFWTLDITVSDDEIIKLVREIESEIVAKNDVQCEMLQKNKQ